MFTIENTDGFSQTDLDILNEAADLVRSEYETDDIAQSSIDDAIGNCWGIVPPTARELATCAAKRLGF